MEEKQKHEGSTKGMIRNQLKNKNKSNQQKSKQTNKKEKVLQYFNSQEMIINGLSAYQINVTR